MIPILPPRIAPLFLLLACLPELLCVWAATTLDSSAGTPASAAVADRFNERIASLPPAIVHATPEQAQLVARRLRSERNFDLLLREKMEKRWFAALLSTDPADPLAIRGRFETWSGFLEFLETHQPLIEVWAYTANPDEPRRIPATELAQWKKLAHEPPTFLTATWLEAAAQHLVSYRIEFGFHAAEQVLSAHRGYLKQRTWQVAVREVLSARDERGALNASAQWQSLQQAIEEGRIEIAQPPAKPENPKDLFVAAEYEVNADNQFSRLLRLYHESELQRRVVQDEAGRTVQKLLLGKPSEKEKREATGFQVVGVSDRLEPVLNPIPGRDQVELRIRNPAEPDPRRWNALEFGEPEILRQSALARFALINGHLERQRKQIALRKSNLDLIAEPIIAAVNIGTGLAGAPFPVGDAVRLGYNVLSTQFIADVPTARELRDLFAQLAARDRDPVLKEKPSEFLSESDVQQLRESGRKLSDAEIAEYVERLEESDLNAMLRLARLQRLDARLSNLMGILTTAGKVSGVTDHAGLWRDLFNNVRFSMSGEINLKTLLAIAAGQRVLTPLSGASLEELSHGQGPAEAWLQFLEVSVDIRAVINSLVRLSKPTLAKKELEKPLPHAPRLTDWAAYEIRIFGFPLLMFYKRGLLKDDIAAFENDYAYGLIGAKIVEHFPTRESMEAEIRAGRMAPLGYVRVPAGFGKWKESNLAVYAHKIPGGKHAGRTSIIIYGLKAYHDHSEFMERELERFRQFEQALEQGGVIEQLFEADGRPVSREFEPALSVGEKAGEQWFAPLLGNLLEWRRIARRQSWGLSASAEESNYAAQLQRALQAAEVDLESGDPLLAVDRYHSAFLVRKKSSNGSRVMKMVYLPSLREIQRDVRKAEAGHRIEQARQRALGGATQGAVLLNAVREHEGRLEIGPLLTNAQGEIAGTGSRIGPDSIVEAFRWIENLPITEKARLRYNRFAGTLLELDADGDGQKEKVFLTIQFPLGRIEQSTTNTLSGEVERNIYEAGLWKESITDRRILEIEYDSANIEIRSRQFLNLGTRSAPRKGALLEETRTLEVWPRDLNQIDLDPAQPIIAKLRVNYVTGQIGRETYGLFPLAMAVADDQFVTENQYTPFGLLRSAMLRENGQADADFARDLWDKVLAPITGRERFRLAALDPDLEQLTDLKSRQYQSTVERVDLIKGLRKTLVLDHAHFGLKLEERFQDVIEANRAIEFRTRFEYEPDFQFGLMPARSFVSSAAEGAVISTVRMSGFDPITRTARGVEVDYTGRTTTNVWNYQWESPVEVASALRQTINKFNRDETAITSATVTTTNSEPVRTVQARFDPGAQRWEVEQTIWHRAGVPLRREMQTLSPSGRVLTVRVGEQLETRAVYDNSGREMARRTFFRPNTTGAFDQLVREESNYQWSDGARAATVATWISGELYDAFQVYCDAEGRVTRDGIKSGTGYALATEIAYEGATERALRADQYLNQNLRQTFWFEPEQSQADGSYLRPVRVVPAWGLTLTNTFRLDDPLARPLRSVYENGDEVVVREWFPATAIAQTSEWIDRTGRSRARYVRRLKASADGELGVDFVEEHKLNAWGDSALAETKALMLGTDLVRFADRAGERIYYDWSRPHQAPAYARDVSGLKGIQIRWGGAMLSNVTHVFATRFDELRHAGATNQASEKVLVVDSVDLRGFFYHKVSQQTFDVAGRLIEEKIGKIPAPGAQGYEREWLLDRMAAASPTKKFIYQYEPGWLFRRSDPFYEGIAGASFSGKPLGDTWRINAPPWRDQPTEVHCIQAPTESELDSPELSKYLFRRLRDPRELKSNPHFPGITNLWIAWTSQELNADQAALFESEIIFNAEGQTAVSLARKRNSAGRPGAKIVYRISSLAPRPWLEHRLTGGENRLLLNAKGRSDFSPADFIYFSIDQELRLPPQLQVEDESGRSVLIGPDLPGETNPQAISFWAVERGEPVWLPNDIIPEHGAVVEADETLAPGRKLFVIALADLAAAGLEVQRLKQFTLIVQAREDERLQVSPVLALHRGGDWIRPDLSKRRLFESELHSSGLTAHSRKPARPAAGNQNERTTLLKWAGLPVAMLSPRQDTNTYSSLAVLDYSDRDSPRPLYALAPETGNFLEYFKSVRWGDAQVYTVASGFQTPKLELFRAEILDDEISPGILAYGFDYKVTIPLAKASGGLAQSAANLHNRMVASAYKLAGDHVINLLANQSGQARLLSHFNAVALHNATNQANDINRLPALAEALLCRRAVPWTNQAAVTDMPLPATNQLAVRFGQLRLLYPRTSLIPTSLGTEMEPFVETIEEANLIQLAIRLREWSVARELLDFYWTKSEGGTQPLHAYYDAQSGASLAPNPGFKRAREADRTAEAQIAMAEAAFALGLESGEAKALTLGKNLITVLLRDFRSATVDKQNPRGISEAIYLEEFPFLRTTLWPEAPRYRVQSNARAFLLLKRLSEISGQYFTDNEWRVAIEDAAREQEAWLRRHILPQVERTGVVPKGLFLVQDISRKTTALAVERWTSARDWLTWIEAARELNVPVETLQGWMDHLARVHGVTIKQLWGIDWSLALTRADAISPELTARFARVAASVDHPRARDFAREQLAELQQRTRITEVFTAAAPEHPLETGQGFLIYPRLNQLGWAEDFNTTLELLGGPMPLATTNPPPQRPALLTPAHAERDLAAFIWTAAGFYLLVLLASFFWWCLSALRRARLRHAQAALSTQLVSDPVMQKAEERWANRVLGATTPAGAERTRFSNAATEQNFHMQLRAIYKLVLEWRRSENGWAEDDPRLVEDGSDAWLNGLDEFATIAGVYSRWVVKAGRKDGLPQEDVLIENEDSNHIWSRLVMYMSELHWGMVELLQQHKTAAEKVAINDQIGQLLRSMGLRRRSDPLDARRDFNVPADAEAFDLLVVQRAGATLKRLVDEMGSRLRIPESHLLGFIRKYKEFKRREQPFPVHPYLIEAAKLLPHFLLTGLVALIWYNNEVGGLLIYPYLRETAAELALSPLSLTWAGPLFAGLILSVAAHYVRIYRYAARKHTQAKREMLVDLTVTSFFTKSESVLPAVKPGRGWNPHWYEWAGWILRGVGLLGLGWTLVQLPAPSCATFFIIKGLLAPLVFMEALAIFVPLAVSRLSMELEDRVSIKGSGNPVIRFLNQLNLTATRPASIVWLSIKYHFQPSIPSGTAWAMARAILFFLLFNAVFFIIGSYVHKEVLSVWFAGTYQNGWDIRLVIGGLLFWNTMYLLRFGLFVFFTGLAGALATFPMKTLGALAAFAWLALAVFESPATSYLNSRPMLLYGLVLAALLAMAWDDRVLQWLKKSSLLRSGLQRRRARQDQALEAFRNDPQRALAVVYMSGDDLSFHKLTPDLLMTRWTLLRDKLDSTGLKLLAQLNALPADGDVEAWFKALYALEKGGDATLWHPMQLVISGQTPRLPPELGVNLEVPSEEIRQQMLRAWQMRRWLVTMMSTAGHGQDTGINLVDIALRLAGERLSPRVAFYLIQNKYDANDNNRPSQVPYSSGELGQRNKLARLLMAIAPGSRAYSINDWTPFGFKAGGLVGMDMIHEETLRLQNMLVVDRNATALDLDSLMEDLKEALSDPGLVIMIPGRSTTNTRTPIGRGSQLLEEGHRALTRGMMLLGGPAGESVGTGWGNIQAIYYGRIQRAMVDSSTPKCPLTSRLHRGSSFGDRVEGLIGFGPHAVGISEDIWGVTQAAHNAIALGIRARFAQSRTLWHKIRETWSHAEWFAAFPRWSGGYLQMMHDPIMQRINDGGPLSVFAKELRAQGGRFYLSAPFALLNILLMPLAIIWDVSPFIQILIVLWNFGFVMNQVLTAHGLIASLESSGFSRISAFLGAALAGTGSWLAWKNAALLPAVLLAGFLAGGFVVGLGRWLYDRGRDILLFGPQLVIHALGQFVRQSLEFVVSGASVNDAKAVNIAFRAWVGPREDRPFETYQNLVNLRTVVWVVGTISIALNLFALSNLDFLNVVLLLPSLLFSVSLIVGPFIMKPKAGTRIGRAIWVPKLLGWIVAAGFYSIVSWFVAKGGVGEIIGGMGLALCFGTVLASALRYVSYSRQLKRHCERLRLWLVAAGQDEKSASNLTQQIVKNAMGDPEKTRALLQKSAMPEAIRESLVALVREQLWPLLRKPQTDLEHGPWARNRHLSEFGRSFVLALFTLLWFFIVPVPGLLIFTAGSYRLSMDLSTVLLIVGGLIGAAIAGAVLARMIEWITFRWRRGLGPQILEAHRQFEAGLLQENRFTPTDVSSLFAWFTAITTYVDQGSLGYARRMLQMIRARLEK